MQEDLSSSVRSDLLERLRAMEGPQTAGHLSELAYRRAREALESALDEARTIRLQAIEDARATRERELASLMDSMRALRQSAESQIEELIRTAELEAARLRDQARTEAQSLIEQANVEVSRVRAEAQALRAGAEQRIREAERIENDFNEIISEIADRLEIMDRPAGGWWKRLLGD